MIMLNNKNIMSIIIYFNLQLELDCLKVFLNFLGNDKELLKRLLKFLLPCNKDTTRIPYDYKIIRIY